MILGICGGYQMLGATIEDAGGVEHPASAPARAGLVAVRTVFDEEKVTRLTTAVDTAEAGARLRDPPRAHGGGG